MTRDASTRIALADPVPAVAPDPWSALRRHTAARIALGRAGSSLPSAALLEFGLAHAAARDAVHAALDADALRASIAASGFATTPVLHSAAPDRPIYLRRPDLGRRLDDASRQALAALAGPAPDLLVVVADGLSALAVQRHALPLLEALRARLPAGGVGQVAVALQGRVALGDEVAQLRGAGQLVVLIGERPGLSSPDSLGVYLTHAPRVGTMDSGRNCISNVRPEGLSIDAAADKLAYLLGAASALGCSGVALKDDSAPALA